MSEKGTLYFFTGLAGAGKTTIGGLFYRRLKARRGNVILVDGDQIRAAHIPGLSRGSVERSPKAYTTQARLMGAKRMFPWCRLLTDQGFDVVCCSISLYDEVRDWNRKYIENYKEIYIKASWDTLVRRKARLYASDEKNVVGVDLPYDEPQNPDFVVENDGQETPEEIVARMEAAFFPEETEA